MKTALALVQIASALLGVVLGSLATSSCSADEAGLCEPMPLLQQGTFPVFELEVDSIGMPPIIDRDGASLTISTEKGVILHYLRDGSPASAAFGVVGRHGPTLP